MSKLIWIDDSIQGLMPLIDNVFPLIWQGGHSADVVLFGNDHCKRNNEKIATEADRKQLEWYMRARFIQFCSNVDEDAWISEGSTYKEKEELIENSRVTLIPIRNSRPESTDKSIPELVQLWTDDKSLAGITSRPAADATMQLQDGQNIGVERLISAMNIPENAVVAIDLCLLYNDLNRLKCGLPVISMAIFNSLREQHRYYLYSGEATPSTLNESWIEIYNKTFSRSSGEKLNIYPKKSLSNNNSLAPAKQQLIRILTQESETLT